MTKRDGSKEDVRLEKIQASLQRAAIGLSGVDPLDIAVKTIETLHDGITTVQLDELSMRAAAGKIFEEPNYSKMAARILAEIISKEVGRDATLFQVTERLYDQGLVTKRHYQFVKKHRRALEATIDHSRDSLFEFLGMTTVYDRYLSRDRESRKVIERPQHWFMRVAVSLAETPEEALYFYETISSFGVMPATPTLLNSGRIRSQLSSCYLLPQVQDSIEGIYAAYTEAALLSKYAGGIGVPWSDIRPAGALIQGTNGQSSGLIPFLKTFDASVSAVNQAGVRRGAAAVYLATHHPDLMDFLELRDQTGDIERRAFNLNLANWIPDLFMKRVEAGADWSFFSPQDVPALNNVYDDGITNDYTRIYEEAERKGLAVKVLPARTVYHRMMKTLTETGNGWMCFSDNVNRNHPQVKAIAEGRVVQGKKVVDSSNLCTEINEVRDSDETAVCNLASIPLAQLAVVGSTLVSSDSVEVMVDWARLRELVDVAVVMLDRVIDRNFYPTESARRQNMKWRNIGLGVMGFHDLLQKLRIPVDHLRASELNRRLFEVIWEQAVETSTRLGGGQQKNSLLIAVAPTATIASIVGTSEGIEPLVSNLFRRETLSGDFIQVNKALVRDLQAIGLWTASTRQQLVEAKGSVQGLDIPEELKALYKTAWEIPAKALIDLQAERNPFVDQSVSLNLFMENANVAKASKMYMYAWRQGLKTTYYLRTRAASSTMTTGVKAEAKPKVTEAEAIACSLENPDSCQSCQ